MPKTVISSDKGLVQKGGGGLEIESTFGQTNEIKQEGAFYSNQSTVTALVTGSFPLLAGGMVHTVDSTDNAHGVRLPNATAAGQLMIVRNVDSGQDVVIRNEDQTGAILVTLGEGKTSIFFSTASGDNWSGSQVD